MGDKTWKNNEREIARRLGGQRVPITGRQRGSAPDVAHSIFSIECKHRASIPGWLKEAVEQAVASIRGRQLAIAIIHEKNSRHDNDLVVLRLKDFEEWFGSGDKEWDTPLNKNQSVQNAPDTNT